MFFVPNISKNDGISAAKESKQTDKDFFEPKPSEGDWIIATSIATKKTNTDFKQVSLVGNICLGDAQIIFIKKLLK